MIDPLSGPLGRRVSTALLAALVPAAGSWACPVPADADSAYHSFSEFPSRARTDAVAVAGPAAARRDAGDGAHCEGGFADVYPCNNIDLLSYMPLAAVEAGEAADLWGWTDPLTGNEYALLGKDNGTAFVDITDPEHPRYLGTLPTQSTPSPWRDLKTIGNHLLVVAEAAGHGMQVFDLTQLRGVVTAVTFSASAHYGGFGKAHNIVVNEQTGFAYAVGTRNGDDGCAGGLHMIDVSQPESPAFAGCYAADGYTHDAQCVVYAGPDTDYSGQEICFNYNEDTLTIVDVSNKSSPQLIARVGYSGSGYTHQGWLTDDHRHLLLDDETDEIDFGHNTRTYIWDVADLDAPLLIGSHEAQTAAIDHNLYVRGNFAYQANYRAGLRILDVSAIAAGTLVENGFFDVYPSSDSIGFNGSWSVYPFFDSGAIIVSGIEQGLFVLQPTALDPGFVLAAAEPVVEICGDSAASTSVTIEAVGSYAGSPSLQSAGAPPGVAVNFDPSSVTPPATSTLSIVTTAAEPGAYTLTLTAVDGALEFDQTLSLHLSDAAPMPPQLLIPAAGASAVSAIQTLYWDRVPGAFSYDFELATDAVFDDIVLSAPGLEQRHFTPPAALAPSTTFYWRVSARNACGAALSSVGSFTTAAPSCATFVSGDVPVAIAPEGAGIYTSTLNTTAPGTVIDVDVLDLRASHARISDIDIRLEGPLAGSQPDRRHPERPSVLIMAQSCDDVADLDINFDDQAAPAPLPCPPTDSGTYRPANPLSGFDGSAGSGDWNLLLSDSVDGDGGALTSWALRICTAATAQPLDLDGDSVDDLSDNCTGLANSDQRDTDSDGFGNLCDPDLDNDGQVNFADLELMRAAFFGADADADLDGDGAVNFADLDRLRQYFFGSPGPSGLTP